MRKKIVNGVEVALSDVEISEIEARERNPLYGFSVDQAKTEILEQNHQAFLKARDAGVTVGGVRVGTSPQQLAEINTLVAGFNGKPDGFTQKIATASGFIGDIDLATAQAFQAAQTGYLSQVWETDADHIERINAAATLEELQGIDVSEGWPS